MPEFLLDANFFITAHRVYYPMDVVPGFWNAVHRLAAAGTLISIDKVRAEIIRNEDELAQWCQTQLPEGFFRDTSAVIEAYRKVIQWAVGRNHYKPEALDLFARAHVADAWLVAYAAANELVLVTEEVSNPASKRAVKLPDACLAQGVDHVNTIGMFRALEVTF